MFPESYEHNGFPLISGFDDEIREKLQEYRRNGSFSGIDKMGYQTLRSAAAVALHMHQPLIPADGDDITTAGLISNLQYMFNNPNEGDNHNASSFLHCYRRMGDMIPTLTEQGLRPRVMLDYSGALLYGLLLLGDETVLESLRKITTNYSSSVEWLGTTWGHAVAPSLKRRDMKLQVEAWQHYFCSLFGIEALSRVQGFSAAEMALPNHPDQAYDYISVLKECGYRWLLVQEHTVEDPETGNTPEQGHIPHRLLCRNSNGDSISMTVIIKTQGSDTKLVGQMQPYYEAKSAQPVLLQGTLIPPLVTQIADGENGGVMMNEFPDAYKRALEDATDSETQLLNCSEYLELLSSLGVEEESFPVVQPYMQKRVFDRCPSGSGADLMNKAITTLAQEDSTFHMEGGSWTNSISWVRGYEDVLTPMEEASDLFFEKVASSTVSRRSDEYRNALLHLLSAQTSCFRYWGEGRWTEYGKELCRRAKEICKNDF